MDLSVEKKAIMIRGNLRYIDGFPVFSSVELNIVAACTRACAFCPVSDKDFYKKYNIKGQLELEVFKKLLYDLKSIGYQGGIIFSGFGEPLLHKKLEELVREKNIVLPNSVLEIITNGDLLTLPKMGKLFEAGLDVICVSLYDGAHQFEHFNKMKTELGLSDSQMWLRRRYYEDGDYGLIISNRGGLVDSDQYRSKGEQPIETLPLQKNCYYPFYMITIDINGDVLACSHDWGKSFVIGNILKENVWDIWKSERFNLLRLSLSHADRGVVPCNRCDTQGNIMGKESFNEWCSRYAAQQSGGPLLGMNPLNRRIGSIGGNVEFCEADIRNQVIMTRYIEMVQEDSTRIFQDHSAFMKIDCPACGNAEPVSQFDKMDFCYVQCGKCKTLFVSPRPAYQDLIKVYLDSPSTRFWVNEFFRPMAEVRREKIFKPRAEFIAENFPLFSSGKLADIGAGFGLFIEELKKLWPASDIVAIEPSVDMAKICRGKGFKVLESTLEDVDLEERFDFMTAFELFEHLHDPLSFVEKVYNLLNPGGYLFLTMLNGLGFDIQILWERAKSVFPPQHLNFFNPHSIEALLVRKGFEIVKIATPGQLDWDIIEGAYRQAGLNPGRFFKTVSQYGTDEAKRDLQKWIRANNFSSHMIVIAKKI